MSHFKKITIVIFAGLFFLTMYEGIRVFTHTPSYILPSINNIFHVFISDRKTLFENFLHTFYVWFYGTTCAVFAGLVMSCAMFRIKIFKSLMTPFLTILQSTPYIILAPLLMIWFGIGIFPKILIIVMSCSFPIVVIVLSELIKSEQKYDILSHQLELSKFKALLKIHLPYSLGGFFEGLKISLSYSYVTAILSEMMGSENGLGVYLIYAQSSYNSDKVLACTLLIICMTLLIRTSVDKLKNDFVNWKQE